MDRNLPYLFLRGQPLNKRSFSLASPLQVISSSPQPPPLRLGKFFVFPILWLVSDQEKMIILSWSDLMYIICLFMQLRISSGGTERHVCSLPYLIMLKSSVFFSHPIFVRNQSLIPYLFQSTQRWALLYILQAFKCSCGLASTLPLQWLQLYGFLKKKKIKT